MTTSPGRWCLPSNSMYAPPLAEATEGVSPIAASAVIATITVRARMTPSLVAGLVHRVDQQTARERLLGSPTPRWNRSAARAVHEVARPNGASVVERGITMRTDSRPTPSSSEARGRGRGGAACSPHARAARRPSRRPRGPGAGPSRTSRPRCRCCSLPPRRATSRSTAPRARCSPEAPAPSRPPAATRCTGRRPWTATPSSRRSTRAPAPRPPRRACAGDLELAIASVSGDALALVQPAPGAKAGSLPGVPVPRAVTPDRRGGPERSGFPGSVQARGQLRTRSLLDRRRAALPDPVPAGRGAGRLPRDRARHGHG